MGQGYRSSQVSIVVRTMGTRDRHLRRALDSVAASTWQPLQVVVVYQGTSVQVCKRLQDMVSTYSRLDGIVVQNPTDIDDRATNLNLGWRAAGGRYLGFLDDDDVVTANHAELLISAMTRSGAAWAYGQCKLILEESEGKLLRRTYPFFRRRYSFTELLIENYIPIHSFLLDRQELQSTFPEPPFFGPLQRSEDWDFLLRLAYGHVPAVVHHCVCTYFASAGGDNTNMSIAPSATAVANEQSGAWAVGRRTVLQRAKEMLRSDPEGARHLAALDYQRSAGPIRRALRRLRLGWFRLLYAVGQKLQARE